MKKTLPVPRSLLYAACVLLLLGFAQMSFAATPSGYPDTLQFFKNYLVNGDYVVNGVGLRGQGDGTGFATGFIKVNNVPTDAVVVAAFLYWETIESTSAPSSANGFFQGYPIVGVSRGTGTSPCWSGGGGTGSSNGSKTLRVYRADVAPFLVVNGQYATNTPANTQGYQVRLSDSGSNGAGTPLTEGASLVIVYRRLADPLRAVVFYDGSWTMNNGTQFMSQTIDWFYQSAAGSDAHLTHIVGDGQSNFGENIFFLQGNTPTQVNLTQPGFSGAAGFSWDNPYYHVNMPDASNIPAGQDRQSAVSTYVLPNGPSFDCLSWGAVIFSTRVLDQDKDGLLDVWEDRHGYYDSANNGVPATWISLPGANKAVPDLFVQMDFLKNTGANVKTDNVAAHTHLPKFSALQAIAAAYSHHNINVHFDVGPNFYQGSNFIVPAANAVGGNALDEDGVSCVDGATLCDFPYATLKIPGIVNWKTGVLAAKNSYFPHGRNDSYHYVLLGHALGFPSSTWSIPDGTLQSIVVANGVATVTTTTPHGLFNGARVSISGAIGDFNLNGAYNILSSTSNSFTVNTPNVAAGTYGAITNQQFGRVQTAGGVLSQEPNLSLSSGAPLSISGFSDLGGGDSLITLGLWKADDAPNCQADPSIALDANHPSYCSNMVGTTTVQAGTIMHEIGHTLYLTHGGYYPGVGFGQNCKPNFLSVMNYLFQIRGLPDRFGVSGSASVDYSGQVFGTLSEAELLEGKGVGLDQNGNAALYGTRYFAPPNFIDQLAQKMSPTRYASLHCDGSPKGANEVAVRVDSGTALAGNPPVASPVNWDNIIPPTYTTVLDQDINFDGINNDTEFDGFSDWDNLHFQQIGSRRNIFGFSADLSASDIGGPGGRIVGGGGRIVGGGADLINGGSQLLGSGGRIVGGGGRIVGGGLNLLGGSLEVDFNAANAEVDPPVNLNAAQSGKSSVTLTWQPPDFGQIRSYSVWRAVITKYPMSATNPPTFIAAVSAKLGLNSYTDTSVKPNQTYEYYVIAALGADSGSNAGNQSGPSNFATVTVH